MSKCSHCLQRMCRRHPLQDHGEREAKLKQMTTGKFSVNSLLQAQIEKLQAEQQRGGSSADIENYKYAMDKERLRAEKDNRKRPVQASEQQQRAAQYAGLNPAVLNVMMQNSDVDSDAGSEDKRRAKKRRKSKKDDDSSNGVRSKRREKEEKRRKKEKKRSEKKKRKREKLEERRKSDRKHRRSSRRSGSSSESSGTESGSDGDFSDTSATQRRREERKRSQNTQKGSSNEGDAADDVRKREVDQGAC